MIEFLICRNDGLASSIGRYRDTGYVTDPEECMADNFAYAMLYGMKGKDGKGYPNPEIIQGIIDYLKQ